MIGQKMNYDYKKYLESLKNTPEPHFVRPPVPIDYEGLARYASTKGVQPADLSDEEKERFVLA